MTAIPRATYRIQLHRDFGFDDAARIAPYLARLGISHVYTSPYLQARPGSTHGYDIVNHASLNPELGGDCAWRRMCKAFSANGLRHVVDVVPNHMGVGGSDNPLWLDVLEWGPESRFAGWFDIDWESHNRYLVGKILVPLLGDQYGVELAAGRLALRFDAARGEFAVWAYDTHKLPICPLHYGAILGNSLATLETMGDDFAALDDWKPEVMRRATELKERLAMLASGDADAAAGIAAAVQHFNADDTDAHRSHLDQLIQKQYWRASHFRVAGDDINYRRFFNVNELAGLRVELPAVFEHTHRLVLDLVASGCIDGLRVDHIDGLVDPTGYIRQLRQAWEAVRSSGPRNQPYLIVEKILAQGERLPGNWSIDGTTGYDFCDLCLQLLVDSRGEAPLTRGYEQFIDRRQTFAQVLLHSKLRVMDNEMSAELNVLSRAAARIARSTPLTADFTSGLLLRAIRAVIACMPVYRTYLHAGSVASGEDLQRLGSAVEAARQLDRELDPSVLTFMERLLSGQLAEPRSGYIRHKVLSCAMRVQQYSGPVMAKGQEDTAFYRYNRFIALNEVGSDPARFGVDVDTWHRAMSERAAQWPHSLLATSTHDTKRGEDARARLAVLSEIPEEWLQHANAWSASLIAGSAAQSGMVDRNDIYYFLQTILASCPAEIDSDTPDDSPAMADFRDRVIDAMRKSMREAKVHTTWIKPDIAYEAAVLDVVDHALRPQRSPDFWKSFAPFLRRVARLGVDNSLAMITLKLTAPGVPDIYQGCEGWNFAMVDPDNRRPVDYDLLAGLLAELEATHEESRRTTIREYLASWQDGRIKLLVTQALLQLRRQQESLFMHGRYQALHVTGPGDRDVCGFLRLLDDSAVAVIVGFFPSRSAQRWMDTRLSLPDRLKDAKLVDVFTGRSWTQAQPLHIDEVLADLPVAVLAAGSCIPPALLP